MSGDEYKKLRFHLRILTLGIIVLAVLLVASLTHTVINPKSNSFPKVQVINGKDGKVDYDRVNQFIESQLASGVTPKNGIDGKSIQGAPGVAGPTGAAGPPGPQGIPGKDGAPGTNAPVLQVRVDHTTCQLQQKYDTSDFWTSIAQLPKPCEVL